MKNLKTTLWIILLIGIWSCVEKEPAAEQITFLVTTNVRGQLDPCGWKANPLGGLPRRATYISEVKDSGVDPILLDAGDALFENYYLINGKVASSKLKAKTILESTAKMGDYIYNVGYQDLAAGFEFIKEMEAS